MQQNQQKKYLANNNRPSTGKPLFLAKPGPENKTSVKTASSSLGSTEGQN